MILIGFKPTEDFTLHDCIHFLSQSRNEKDPERPVVVKLYLMHMQKLKQEDEQDYLSCKSIVDYNWYLDKYTKLSNIYIAKHLDDARKKIKEINIAMQQLNCIEKQKRKKRIIVKATFCLVIIVLVLIFDYHYTRTHNSLFEEVQSEYVFYGTEYSGILLEKCYDFSLASSPLPPWVEIEEEHCNIYIKLKRNNDGTTRETKIKFRTKPYYEPLNVRFTREITIKQISEKLKFVDTNGELVDM